MLVQIDTIELRSLIRDAVAEALGRPSVPSRASVLAKGMITANEADWAFRKAKGTAAAAFRAGVVRGEERAGASRTGKVIYIRTADAQRTWGGDMATDLAQETT